MVGVTNWSKSRCTDFVLRIPPAPTLVDAPRKVKLSVHRPEQCPIKVKSPPPFLLATKTRPNEKHMAPVHARTRYLLLLRCKFRSHTSLHTNTARALFSKKKERKKATARVLSHELSSCWSTHKHMVSVFC
jgi:hypothetical protein